MLLRVPLRGWGSLASLHGPPGPPGSPPPGSEVPHPVCSGSPAVGTSQEQREWGLQVGCDSGCGALAKCLVELREYGSRPGFSVTSSSTCNAVSTWLTQGKGLLVMNSQSALV